MKFFALCVFLVFIINKPTLAYYSTFTTAETLDENYQLSAEAQFLTDEPSGINMVGRFHANLNDGLDFIGMLGLGEIDFHTGAFIKWVPIPDLESGQPAIGIIIGGLYAQYDGENELSLRLTPIVSKKFNTDIGLMTPYLSLPLGVRSYNDENDVPFQLAIGTEWLSKYFKDIRFLSEIGVDLDDANTYISFGANLTFDSESGVKFE